MSDASGDGGARWGGRPRRRRRAAPEPEPRILPREAHPISRQDIDHDALKVMYRLDRQGYRAFLVGGSVRDLMLERAPKDFDVSTDARPEQIRKIFRNARIIGRRFRLAHILFKGNVVEVATFRSPPDPREQKGDGDDLLITSDNTFGTPATDAFRRDFTINALFYDIADFSVIDYVGGIRDLDDGIVRVIGDPDVRFQEDPVRMLRACEFAGRLDFTIDAVTQQGIRNQCEALERAAAPRLTEELLGLLRSGHADVSFDWMRELGMLDVLLPELDAVADDPDAADGFGDLLRVIDHLPAKTRRGVPDAVLLAAVLLPEVMARRFDAEAITRRTMPISVFRDMALDVVEGFLERFALANHKKTSVLHVYEQFHRLCTARPDDRRARQIARKRHFTEALTLLEWLCTATGDALQLLDAWRNLAVLVPPESSAERSRGDGGGRRPSSRRRRRRAPRR